MARSRQRTSGIFTGLVLLTVGFLLLLHNYRGLELGDVLLHWWPLALIFLGLIKLYERTVARRTDDPGSARSWRRNPCWFGHDHAVESRGRRRLCQAHNTGNLPIDSLGMPIPST